MVGSGGALDVVVIGGLVGSVALGVANSAAPRAAASCSAPPPDSRLLLARCRLLGSLLLTCCRLVGSFLLTRCGGLLLGQLLLLASLLLGELPLLAACRLASHAPRAPAAWPRASPERPPRAHGARRPWPPRVPGDGRPWPRPWLASRLGPGSGGDSETPSTGSTTSRSAEASGVPNATSSRFVVALEIGDDRTCSQDLTCGGRPFF